MKIQRLVIRGGRVTVSVKNETLLITQGGKSIEIREKSHRGLGDGWRELAKC